ncbi:hypothetical protein SAMN05444354_103312 [Stigmatella aurantiaca]|uniref:Uncharacterized protein n=1 Tax=Stigmatella aurantiaca TaxID=41 RepID=A0A1H7LR65_STIAU|nr:hypothetical protein [Stigmatella aurantiaca]SEL01379.1 hypothetical protein SAMN05444354_103312 [Stigmatella aurantiaca]
MQRAAGYTESGRLTQLIEQLRERLGSGLLQADFSQELEAVLARLLMRNQRLRVLQRMTRNCVSLESAAAIRTVIEQLDEELLRELPPLLERLEQQHA